jgi:hypothetical protein
LPWSFRYLAKGTAKIGLRAAEQDRPDVVQKRRRWRTWQRFVNPARLVFLDETATATNLTRRYGRNPLGQRLVAAVPHGHWRTTNLRGRAPLAVVSKNVVQAVEHWAPSW